MVTTDRPAFRTPRQCPADLGLLAFVAELALVAETSLAAYLLAHRAWGTVAGWVGILVAQPLMERYAHPRADLSALR